MNNLVQEGILDHVYMSSVSFLYHF